MIVLTVYIPDDDLEKIKKLVGKTYPSRSELIRCAVRELLIKELELASKQEQKENLKPEPNMIIIGNKQYKIIKKLV
ncbi:MAG: ribbon-helix-helix domain-containing protein [Promethearchaeota archaeon]